MLAGLDGGYLRSAHRPGHFNAAAGTDVPLSVRLRSGCRAVVCSRPGGAALSTRKVDATIRLLYGCNRSVATWWRAVMGFPDRIERTVELAHSPARVWAALTTAEGLAAWFGDEATIDL